MKVLMISKDAKIFEKGSVVRARMVLLGKLFTSLQVIVISRGSFKDELLSENVSVRHEAVNNALQGVLKLIRGLSVGGLEAPDIVTVQDPFETSIFGYRIAKKFNVPLQVQIHADIFSPYFTHGSLKNIFRQWMAKKYLPKAGCIRVVSGHIKDSIVSCLMFHVSNIFVLPVFVDAKKILEARRASLPEPGDFNILWVGRFEQEKNPMLAVEAFREFVKKVPTARLFFIGDGSLRKELELYAKRYTLKAHFLGWKDVIAGYYKSADVLLATSWHEGYGMAMVEARIAGLPVVSPDVGVAREVGAHITSRNAEDIARILNKIYNGESSLLGAYRYPYADKEEYLRAYKQSFEQCLLNKKTS